MCHLCVCLLCSGEDTGLVEITSVYVPLSIYLSLSLEPLSVFWSHFKLDLHIVVLCEVVLPDMRCHLGGFKLQQDKTRQFKAFFRDVQYMLDQ